MMPPLRFLAVLTAVSLTALAPVGCGSARRSEPIAGPLPLTSTGAVYGQRIFMAQCHQCHPGGEAGLGPAINNKPLPQFLIRFQIRHGVGAMPAFPEQDMSDEEIDQVLAYLADLRNHG